MTEYEFHEVAALFPNLREDEFAKLKEDIRKNGLQLPIQLYEGKILDGRHRYRACRELKIEPRTEEARIDDPVVFVCSMNLHRRHLTVSQAAMCAARARDLYAKQAKERQKIRKGNQPGATPDKCGELHPCEASEEVGRVFGVSGGSVDRARRVIENGLPELVEAVPMPSSEELDKLPVEDSPGRFAPTATAAKAFPTLIRKESP